MNTFLPYADFAKSAEVLDYRRLGKQRVECWQILTALVENKGWIHHPCTHQWRGYEGFLVLYGQAICKEWIGRGYEDIMLERFTNFSLSRFPPIVKPWWLGYEPFHASHRSNLLRKDPIWYGKFGWSEPNNLEYVWPSKISIYA